MSVEPIDFVMEWSDAWAAGNLTRPGYYATTDRLGSYAEHDVGTFPNKTNKNKLGPTPALHSDFWREKHNYDLSWLSGQRLSACSCPGPNHPSPSVTKARGAPEIDIFEAKKDKDNAQGHVVSQSAQFAPFTLYDNLMMNQWEVFDPEMTRPNSYRGSALLGHREVVSDMSQGLGKVFKKIGFEYCANPSNAQEGYITTGNKVIGSARPLSDPIKALVEVVSGRG